MKNVFVVLNPKAGSVELDTIRRSIKEHFHRVSWKYELYMTTGQERDRETIIEATNNGYSCFIAVGGDGTISEVAECLIDKEIPLGIIPTGTGNGIARALSIPLELEDALHVATQEEGFRTMDAMKLGERYFFLFIGIGLSAVALEQMEIEKKRLLGRIYYSLLAIKAFFGFHPHQFRIELDGKPLYARGSEVMLINCGTLGDPLLQWEQDIQMDDGQIDVYIIRARTIYDYFRLVWYAIAGHERQDPSVSAFRMAEGIKIQTHPPLPAQGDGDIIQHTPIEVEVVPQAIKVIAPPS